MDVPNPLRRDNPTQYSKLWLCSQVDSQVALRRRVGCPTKRQRSQHITAYSISQCFPPDGASASQHNHVVCKTLAVIILSVVKQDVLFNYCCYSAM